MKVAIIHNQDLTGVINRFGMQNKEFYSERTVQKVAKCLERAGHNVEVMDGNMRIIDRLESFMPRVEHGGPLGMVFNMAYGIQGESRYTHIPSMLEMLGIPYVGSSPSGHALALDKVMTKIIWQKHGLPTPPFHVLSSPDEDLSGIEFPAIVKPKMESVSFGLRVVNKADELRDAVQHVATEFQQQALVERFIRGREFCVGLLGNDPVESFPLLEIDLGGDPDAIQTVDDKRQRPRGKICPAHVDGALSERIRQLSVAAFRALELRDFARVDVRVDEDGGIHLIEINSMASLGETGSYVAAAHVAGYDFSRLVNRMLDVAATRYFAASVTSPTAALKKARLPLHSRLRAYLRGRSAQSAVLLRRLVNINTHPRSVENVNQCSSLIVSELRQFGFEDQVYPQVEVGNVHYAANCAPSEVETLLLMPLDSQTEPSEHNNFHASEDRLYGTGIWETKGGVAVCLSALSALRFAKLLSGARVGILLIPDSTLAGRYSRAILGEKAQGVRRIVGLHGGNPEGSIVTSRSGSASYSFSVRLVDTTSSQNVAAAARFFTKTLASIAGLSRDDPDDVVAPYQVRFHSNILRAQAYGTARISVRYNHEPLLDRIDEELRKLAIPSKTLKKKLDVQFEGGIKRPPMVQSSATAGLLSTIKDVAARIDTVIVEEHRWSSSDICSVETELPKVDGMGPIGGYDRGDKEYILRHGLIDRALLLALLLHSVT